MLKIKTTIRSIFLFVNILYTRQVFENRDPKMIVKPSQKEKERT